MEAASREAQRTEPKVSSLELFFDLVFVLAFTQVTTKLSVDQTWAGVGRAVLMLAVLWWAWGGYAWLTNAFDPESKLMRTPVFIAMAALLIAALAVPTAFGENAVIFAIAYFVVRILHQVLYYVGARPDPEYRRAVLSLAPAFVLAPALILVSTAFDGWAQAAFWIVAIAIDYGGPYLISGEGWQVAPDHFAERFGLIVIIALGESIVSIGVGATGLPLDLTTISAAILGMLIASAFWWMYFDVVALAAAAALAREKGADRMHLARDSYSVMHCLLIIGIIFVALGIKKTIAHPEHHLEQIPAVALCLGIALFAGTLSALKKRDYGSWNKERALTALLFLALIPLAQEISALAALGVAFAVLAALITYETITYRESRARIRAAT